VNHSDHEEGIAIMKKYTGILSLSLLSATLYMPFGQADAMEIWQFDHMRKIDQSRYVSAVFQGAVDILWDQESKEDARKIGALLNYASDGSRIPEARRPDQISKGIR